MDLFKFNNWGALDATYLMFGESIEGYTIASWTERYRNAGEVKIVAPLSSGLREFLPIGTFVSHKDTLEVMSIENHEVKEDQDTDPIITITGRSLEAYLEQRVVGQNQNWSNPPTVKPEYQLAADYTCDQVVKLINDHIHTGAVDPNENYLDMYAWTPLASTATNEARVMSRGTVYSRVTEVLAVDDLGIRTMRRNPWDHPWSDEWNTRLVIHNGFDRSDQVMFSWKSGDLDGADYFWSVRNMKNAALVTGQYVETAVVPMESGFDRRWMVVDGGDLDGHLDTVPTGATLNAIRGQMAVRGKQALENQKNLSLIRADISETSKYQFRKDYDIGDLVMVDGNYGEIRVMRVTEFLEIDDENGTSGHPTLSVLPNGGVSTWSMQH